MANPAETTDAAVQRVWYPDGSSEIPIDERDFDPRTVDPFYGEPDSDWVEADVLTVEYPDAWFEPPWIATDWQELPSDPPKTAGPHLQVDPAPANKLPPSTTPIQDWADRTNARLAEPIVRLQHDLSEVQTAVERLLRAERAKVERRTLLVLAWMFFACVFYISVLNPLVVDTATGVKRGLDRWSELPRALMGDLFAGAVADQIGIRIKTLRGECRVTDIRRFRPKHPVTGLPQAHNGVDTACNHPFPAIHAPFHGTLNIIEPNASNGGGLVARIRSEDGKWMVQILHNHKITAKPGPVRAGQQLGWGAAPLGSKNAGKATAPHVHIEIANIEDGLDRRVYRDVTTNLLRAVHGASLPTDVAPPEGKR